MGKIDMFQEDGSNNVFTCSKNDQNMQNSDGKRSSIALVSNLILENTIVKRNLNPMVSSAAHMARFSTYGR